MAGWGLSDFSNAISSFQDTVKSLEKQVDNALGVDEATLRQEVEKTRQLTKEKEEKSAESEAAEANTTLPAQDEEKKVSEATKGTKKTPTKTVSAKNKSRSTPPPASPTSMPNGHAKGEDDDFFAAVGFSPSSDSGGAPKAKPKTKGKTKTSKKLSGSGTEAKKATVSKKAAPAKTSAKVEDAAKPAEETGKSSGTTRDSAESIAAVETPKVIDAKDDSSTAAKEIESPPAPMPEPETKQADPVARKEDNVIIAKAKDMKKTAIQPAAKNESKEPAKKEAQSEGKTAERAVTKKSARENGEVESRSKKEEIHTAPPVETAAVADVENVAPVTRDSPLSEPASEVQERSLRLEEELETARQSCAEMQSELEKLQGAKQRVVGLEQEIEAVKDEYGERLAAAERKLYALSKERDHLKKDLEKKGNTSELLREKENFIKQVLAEGEQLSKKQASQESSIKKLKTQIRELEGEKEKLNQKISIETARGDTLAADKAKAEADLKGLGEEMEKRLHDAKTSAVKDLEAERALRSDTESKLAESMRKELEIKAEEALKKAEVLENQCKQLQETQAMSLEAANHREEMLMAEVKDLRSRCEMAESRHAELVARVPEQTRPLLRQIEALQGEASAASAAYAVSEQALSTRLEQATSQLAGAEERSRMAAERLSSSQARIAELEEQVHVLRVEASQAQAKEKDAKENANKSREEIEVSQATITELEQKLAQLEKKSSAQIANLREELTLTESALKLAQEEREEISRNLKDVEEKLRSQQEEINSTKQQESDEGDRLLAALSVTRQTSLDSESLARLDELENSLAQKEVAIGTLRSNILSLEKTRDSLAEELVTATQSLETARKEAEEGQLLKSEFLSLQRRHASALELMGERDEQVDELKADLLDVKGAYRDQIDLMCQQLEAAYKEISILKEQRTNGS